MTDPDLRLPLQAITTGEKSCLSDLTVTIGEAGDIQFPAAKFVGVRTAQQIVAEERLLAAQRLVDGAEAYLREQARD